MYTYEETRQQRTLNILRNPENFDLCLIIIMFFNQFLGRIGLAWALLILEGSLSNSFLLNNIFYPSYLFAAHERRKSHLVISSGRMNPYFFYAWNKLNLLFIWYSYRISIISGSLIIYKSSFVSNLELNCFSVLNF